MEHSVSEFYTNLSKTTQTTPLLTIVTIFRNPGELIKTNLAAMLMQELPTENFVFEHVLIDGKSTDNTLSIAKQYAEEAKYPVRIYSQVDRGISHAFNIGIEQARGNWLWFLNSDDFLCSPGVVKSVLNKLVNLSNNVCILAGQITFTDEKLQYNLGIMVPKPEKVSMGMYLPHPALIASREVFEACGGFSESFKIGMDYEWLTRVCRHKKKFFERIKILNELLVIYRRSGVSSTAIELVWREFYSARLLNEKVGPASLKYLYVLWRDFVINLMNKINVSKNTNSFSVQEKVWIDKVLNISHNTF